MSDLLEQSAIQLLNGRSKELDRQKYAYRIEGGDGYGMDMAINEDPVFDEAEMSMWIPYADSRHRDGVGDLLEVGGIDVSRHVKNPVCLFDHGKSVVLPIGLAENPKTGVYENIIDPVGKIAKLNCRFYQGKGIPGADRSKDYDHAIFCEQLYDLATKKFLRGGSLGYQVKSARELPPDYETGTPKGLHLMSVLMLEGSLVVMPANADTVAKALSLPSVCGKPLSPMLVKSLSPYAPEKKVMLGWEGKSETVPVPLDNLPDTKIPPPEWKPGVGAEKSLSAVTAMILGALSAGTMGWTLAKLMGWLSDHGVDEAEAQAAIMDLQKRGNLKVDGENIQKKELSKKKSFSIEQESDGWYARCRTDSDSPDFREDLGPFETAAETAHALRQKYPSEFKALDSEKKAFGIDDAIILGLVGAGTVGVGWLIRKIMRYADGLDQEDANSEIMRLEREGKLRVSNGQVSAKGLQKKALVDDPTADYRVVATGASGERVLYRGPDKEIAYRLAYQAKKSDLYNSVVLHGEVTGPRRMKSLRGRKSLGDELERVLLSRYPNRRKEIEEFVWEEAWDFDPHLSYRMSEYGLSPSKWTQMFDQWMREQNFGQNSLKGLSGEGKAVRGHIQVEVGGPKGCRVIEVTDSGRKKRNLTGYGSFEDMNRAANKLARRAREQGTQIRGAKQDAEEETARLKEDRAKVARNREAQRQREGGTCKQGQTQANSGCTPAQKSLRGKYGEKASPSLSFRVYEEDDGWYYQFNGESGEFGPYVTSQEARTVAQDEIQERRGDFDRKKSLRGRYGKSQSKGLEVRFEWRENPSGTPWERRKIWVRDGGSERQMSFTDLAQQYGQEVAKRMISTSIRKGTSNWHEVPGVKSLPRQGTKSLDMSSVRKKYRPTKTLRRRLRKSVPGSSLVHVAPSDLNAAREMAEAKGLKFDHVGSAGGLSRVKLMGDDSGIDAVAQEFGKSVRGRKSFPLTGIKRCVVQQESDGWYARFSPESGDGTDGAPDDREDMGPFDSEQEARQVVARQNPGLYIHRKGISRKDLPTAPVPARIVKQFLYGMLSRQKAVAELVARAGMTPDQAEAEIAAVEQDIRSKERKGIKGQKFIDFDYARELLKNKYPTASDETLDKFIDDMDIPFKDRDSLERTWQQWQVNYERGTRQVFERSNQFPEEQNPRSYEFGRGKPAGSGGGSRDKQSGGGTCKQGQTQANSGCTPARKNLPSRSKSTGDTEFNQGVAARLSGEQQNDNPYPIGSEAADSWNSGWVGGQGKAMKKKDMTTRGSIDLDGDVRRQIDNSGAQLNYAKVGNGGHYLYFAPGTDIFKVRTALERGGHTFKITGEAEGWVKPRAKSLKAKGKSMDNTDDVYMDDDPLAEASKDMGMNPEHPFSAQVLKRLHEKALEDLEEGDSWMTHLEHPEVKKFVQKHLEGKAAHLDEIEALHAKHHPELPGLGDAETKDLDEEELGETEGELDAIGDELDDVVGDLDEEFDDTEEDKDLDTMDDDSVPADSASEDEPTPEEALEGMETADGAKHLRRPLRRRVKSLKDEEFDEEFIGKRLRRKGIEEIEELTEDEKRLIRRKRMERRMKSVCPECGIEGCDCTKSMDGPPPEFTDQIDNGLDAMDQKGLEDHEMSKVGEAAQFANELATSDALDEEKRMKAFHYHKTLEGMGQIEDLAAEHKSEFVGDPQFWQEEGAEAEHKDMGTEHPGAMAGSAEEAAVNGPAAEAQIPPAKSIHPHRQACKDAAQFFGDTAATKDWGEPHKQHASVVAKALEEVAAAPINKPEPVTDEAVIEVGEMGEKSRRFLRRRRKSVDELKKEEEEAKALRKNLIEQQKQVKELRRMINGIGNMTR